MTSIDTGALLLPGRMPPARDGSAAPSAVREGPSLARRRVGAAIALVLMLATLPLQLLGLALIGLEVLSPSTDGSESLLVGGVGGAQLVLLLIVASIGQLVGGGGHPWRRRFAFSCVNAALVLAAAAVAWAFLL